MTQEIDTLIDQLIDQLALCQETAQQLKEQGIWTPTEDELKQEPRPVRDGEW